MTNDNPKDEAISRLYRESAVAEPPASLDAAIRGAAREALVRLPARPRPGWQRWRLPVGVFATLVLTVSLSLLVERERDREAAPADAPATARAVQGTAGKAAPAVPMAQEQAAPAPAPEKSALAARRVVPPMPAEPAAARAAPAAAPAPSPASEAFTADAVKARPALAEDRGSGLAAERVPAAPMMKRELKSATPAALAPEAWIEEIRRLQREGRIAEAQRQLAEFARAYPDYRLPEDVKR